MFSNEILLCLKNLPTYHHGVYPADLLPRHVQTPSAIVVNSDIHTKPGSHWRAIFINKNRELDFFDSYGRPPEVALNRFIQGNSRVARFNSHLLQGLSSRVCGHYCLVFLYYRSQGVSLDEFLTLFCNNPKYNDFKIYEIFKILFQNAHTFPINTLSCQTSCCKQRALS